MVLGEQSPTPQQWRAALKRLFGPYANDVLALYPGNDDDETRRSATSLASDIFISHATRRWVDAHRETGVAPVYYYDFTHKRPPKRNPEPDDLPEDGAVHTSEIKYALDTLGMSNRFIWTLKDRMVAALFSNYLVQFVKTGDPNEAPRSIWPAAREEQGGLLRMEIGEITRSFVDRDGPRHTFLRRYYADNPLPPDPSRR